MADVAPQKGFNVNLAKEGFVFSPKSAYYVGIPQDIDKAHKTIQRDVMRKYAKENLAGNKYPSPIGNINITMKGIEKTLTQSHNLYFEKNNSLYKLPDILKGAKHIATTPDTKGKVKNIHYLEVNIANNKKSYITIKESNNGDFNLYTIQDNNKGVPKTKNG
jgi:hypothetical protein